MGFPFTTFSDTYDWAAVDNIGAFWAAIAERHKIINDGIGTGPADPFPSRLPAAGDYVAGLIGGLAFTPVDLMGMLHVVKFAFCIDTMQTWITTYIGHFVATAVGGVPVSNYAGKTGLHFWNTQSGSSSENIFDYISTYGTDAAGNHSGFTRQRPARIFTVADTAYDDNAGNTNNVVANGHTAYCNTDGLKYTRTAGVWVLATDQSTLCTVLVGVGTMRAGDYIGPWIWRELYLALKELRWTASHGNPLSLHPEAAAPSGTNSFLRTGLENRTTEAAAKAAALGDYTGTETSPESAPIRIASYVHNHLSGTSPSTDAFIQRMRAKIVPGNATDTVATTVPLMARTWDFYYLAQDYVDLTFHHYPRDDLGTGLDVSGNLALAFSEGPTAASKTESSDTLPLAGVDPTWPTTTVVSTPTELDKEGGCILSLFIVFRWDVLGGLVYL